MPADPQNLLQGLNPTKMAIVIVIFMGGWVLSRLISRSLGRVATRHFDSHQSMLIKRSTYYVLMGATVISALNEAGINLSVLVGAAGVASVAIGFASQTSMSNLISGIFIVIEKPFKVGDTIRIGTTTGEVAVMGLLSTIMKTADNVMVRIPNETLMKSEIFNTTRYGTRRFDITLALTYGANLKEVRDVLLEAAKSDPNILQTPAPSVAFKDYSPTSVNIVFSAWVKLERLADAGFEIPIAIKSAFDKANIDFATQHRPLSLSDARAIRVDLAPTEQPSAEQTGGQSECAAKI